MKLSKPCKDRLCTLYKNESEKIIYRVENLIDLIKSKYHLKNISFITNMSYNIILSAYSDEWKNVIVKIGIIKENINREILFYYNYKNNDKCCEIYVCDREKGYIIMKKIEPGLKLDSIKCLDERLKIFKQVYNNINNKYDYTVKLPKYKTILYKEFDNFNIDFLRIYTEKAKKYYRNIERLNMPKYILHGDLHHWNILKETNCWKIIDPVGFIGEKIFDTVVFLQRRNYIVKSK